MTGMNLNLVLAVVAAYLIGSLSFAVITSRLMGLADPRTYGSGNPGATNVLRSGSKAAAIVTLVFDALKGYLPVLAIYLWGQPLGLGVDAAVAVGLAAFLGHLWPVFFKFQGGKGVATAAGVLFALNPLLGVATLASFALIVAFSRFVSLASMVAAAFAPFYQALIWGLGPIVWGTAAMGALLVWRHRANIERLLAGTESKLGAKKNG
jgi:glycerol-3-phosphate acyltransferase PlsY